MNIKHESINVMFLQLILYVLQAECVVVKIEIVNAANSTLTCANLLDKNNNTLLHWQYPNTTTNESHILEFKKPFLSIRTPVRQCYAHWRYLGVRGSFICYNSETAKKCGNYCRWHVTPWTARLQNNSSPNENPTFTPFLPGDGKRRRRRWWYKS